MPYFYGSQLFIVLFSLLTSIFKSDMPFFKSKMIQNNNNNKTLSETVILAFK